MLHPSNRGHVNTMHDVGRKRYMAAQHGAELEEMQTRVAQQESLAAERDLEVAERARLDAMQTFYHGTSVAAGLAIQSDGFNVDLSGSNAGTMLGNGVYLTTTLRKAMTYAETPAGRFGQQPQFGGAAPAAGGAFAFPAGGAFVQGAFASAPAFGAAPAFRAPAVGGRGRPYGGCVLELKVDLGRCKELRPGDPMMRTWHQHGFDSAHSGDGGNGRMEEHCVRDASRVTVVDIVLANTGMAGRAGYSVQASKLTLDPAVEQRWRLEAEVAAAFAEAAAAEAAAAAAAAAAAREQKLRAGAAVRTEQELRAACAVGDRVVELHGEILLTQALHLAAGTTLRGGTLRGGSGLEVRAGGARGAVVHVEGVAIFDSRGNGIHVEDGGVVAVRGGRIVGCRSIGICVDGAGSRASLTDVVVENSGNFGIYAGCSGVVSLHGGSVSGSRNDDYYDGGNHTSSQHRAHTSSIDRGHVGVPYRGARGPGRIEVQCPCPSHAGDELVRRSDLVRRSELGGAYGWCAACIEAEPARLQVRLEAAAASIAADMLALEPVESWLARFVDADLDHLGADGDAAPLLVSSAGVLGRALTDRTEWRALQNWRLVQGMNVTDTREQQIAGGSAALRQLRERRDAVEQRMRKIEELTGWLGLSESDDDDDDEY